MFREGKYLNPHIPKDPPLRFVNGIFDFQVSKDPL